MLKQRLIFGILGIMLALGVLIFCSEKVIGVCVGVIALIGIYEFYKVNSLFKNKSVSVYAGFIFSALIFAATVFYEGIIDKYLMLILTAYVFVLMLLLVLCHSKCTFKDAALSFLGTIYITFFFLHIIFIRCSNLGYLNIWLIFISAWATDTFAYFAGRLLGKHKLCPSISPKKTVEGAVGGVIGCIVFICIYVFFCVKYAGVNANYLYAVVFAVLTAVASQLGDLAASCIKRENNVKDYGNLIPGHGGILDRFDSALLISPLVYYFILYLPVITKF